MATHSKHRRQEQYILVDLSGAGSQVPIPRGDMTDEEWTELNRNLHEVRLSRIGWNRGELPAGVGVRGYEQRSSEFKADPSEYMTLDLGGKEVTVYRADIEPAEWERLKKQAESTGLLRTVVEREPSPAKVQEQAEYQKGEKDIRMESLERQRAETAPPVAEDIARHTWTNARGEQEIDVPGLLQERANIAAGKRGAAALERVQKGMEGTKGVKVTMGAPQMEPRVDVTMGQPTIQRRPLEVADVKNAALGEQVQSLPQTYSMEESEPMSRAMVVAPEVKPAPAPASAPAPQRGLTYDDVADAVVRSVPPLAAADLSNKLASGIQPYEQQLLPPALSTYGQAASPIEPGAAQTLPPQAPPPQQQAQGLDVNALMGLLGPEPPKPGMAATALKGLSEQVKAATGEMVQANQAMAGATRQRAAAEIQAADQMKQKYDEQAAWEESYAKRSSELGEQHANAMLDLSEQMQKTAQINPNRLWQNGSNAQKFVSVAAMLVGGLVAGKGENKALAAFNKLVKDDVEAQIQSANLRAQGLRDAGTATNNAYQALRQAGLDERTAKLGALSATREAAGQELQRIASQYNLATVDQQVAKLNADIKMQGLKAQAEIAQGLDAHARAFANQQLDAYKTQMGQRGAYMGAVLKLAEGQAGDSLKDATLLGLARVESSAKNLMKWHQQLENEYGGIGGFFRGTLASTKLGSVVEKALTGKASTRSLATGLFTGLRDFVTEREQSAIQKHDWDVYKALIPKDPGDIAAADNVESFLKLALQDLDSDAVYLSGGGRAVPPALFRTRDMIAKYLSSFGGGGSGAAVPFTKR